MLSLEIISLSAETLENSNSKNKDAEKDNNDEQPLDEPTKPKKGKFRTRIVGIHRQKDPRAFKCSSCDKCTMTL